MIYSVQSLADPLTGLSPDSSEFRRRARRTWLSDDPDTATAETVEEMCREIDQAAKDPAILYYARRAVATFRGGPGWAGRIDPYLVNDALPELAKADSIFWWCKFHLRFKHHGEMFEAWSSDLGDPRTKLQLLIAPDVLLRMRTMEGDCAIYTMMVCAMLNALGIGYRLMTIAWDRREPEIFKHVCARAVSRDGVVRTLDASHGDYPGWQIPDRDILRAWQFNPQGQQISDARFRGLHGYRRGFGWRGFGQMSFEGGGTSDEAEGYTPPSDVNPTQVFGDFSGTDWSGVPQSGGGFVVPDRSSTAWAQVFNNLTKMGFTLAQINAIQPGTVVGANGQILRQNPGYSVPSPFSNLLPANLSAGTSNLLLYGGIGLVALMVVSSMFKGRR